jgi:O-antigen/teichoic acid export membrane protein
MPSNAILIPHFGIAGPALATTASLIGGCTPEACTVHKRLCIGISWRRPLAAGAVLITVAAWVLATGRQPGTLFGCVLWWIAAAARRFAIEPSAMRREIVARIQVLLNTRAFLNSRCRKP